MEPQRSLAFWIPVVSAILVVSNFQGYPTGVPMVDWSTRCLSIWSFQTWDNSGQVDIGWCCEFANSAKRIQKVRSWLPPVGLSQHRIPDKCMSTKATLPHLHGRRVGNSLKSIWIHVNPCKSPISETQNSWTPFFSAIKVNALTIPSSWVCQSIDPSRGSKAEMNPTPPDRDLGMNPNHFWWSRDSVPTWHPHHEPAEMASKWSYFFGSPQAIALNMTSIYLGKL